MNVSMSSDMSIVYRINAASATAFMPLAGQKEGWAQCGAMEADTESDARIARDIREWMKRVMKEKDWSARHWAGAAKVTPSTVQKAIKDDYPFVTSSKTLVKLARAAGVDTPDFARTGASASKDILLPIRFEVAASGFLPRDEMPQQPYGYREVAPIRPFADFTQWIERVVNDSMDRLIPPGSEIHVVDAIELGYVPRHDDVVVIERSRLGGALVERTVKQVALTAAGPEFWPRSHNARWKSPISLTADTTSTEDVEVRIVGLMIRAYLFTEPPASAEIEAA